MDYANKVVAITGGARGIGLAMAQAFHTRGARIALADLDGAETCLLYTSPSPRDRSLSRMPSSA